jgi:hypothetical protein
VLAVAQVIAMGAMGRGEHAVVMKYVTSTMEAVEGNLVVDTLVTVMTRRGDRHVDVGLVMAGRGREKAGPGRRL